MQDAVLLYLKMIEVADVFVHSTIKHSMLHAYEGKKYSVIFDNYIDVRQEARRVTITDPVEYNVVDMNICRYVENSPGDEIFHSVLTPGIFTVHYNEDTGRINDWTCSDEPFSGENDTRYTFNADSTPERLFQLSTLGDIYDIELYKEFEEKCTPILVSTKGALNDILISFNRLDETNVHDLIQHLDAAIEELKQNAVRREYH